MKKIMPTFAQISKYATNINIRNDTITYRVAGAKEAIVYTAKIPNFNYTRMTTDWCDLPITVPATYAQIPTAATGWYPNPANCFGDPNDGLIDHILGALNTAMGSDGVYYDPVTQGQWQSHFSNGTLRYRVTGDTWMSSTRYRNVNTGENLLTGNGKYGMIYNTILSSGTPVSFKFTGGNTFTHGIHCWGCEPITDPELTRLQYPFGACEFQYSRWIDIVSPELTQYTKFKNQGTSARSGLLARLYNDGTQKVGVENVFFAGEQQHINMRKDESLNIVTVRLLDEYGELYYVPTGAITIDPLNPLVLPQDWPNNQGITLGMIAQL
jgi:hypothetical protein